MRRIPSRFSIVGTTPDGVQDSIESGLTRGEALGLISKWKSDGVPAKAKKFERFSLAEMVLHGKSYKCRVNSTQAAKTTPRDS